MNSKQKIRLATIIGGVMVLAGAVGLILYALKQNINLFYTPTQLQQTEIRPDQTIRLGGYVKNKSIHFAASGQEVDFIITDHHTEINIHYHGLLPNLFREGQGVVVTGKLQNAKNFLAFQVLAKHDEKYMPPLLLERKNKP